VRVQSVRREVLALGFGHPREFRRDLIERGRSRISRFAGPAMMGTRTPYPSARNAASSAPAAGSPGRNSRAEGDCQDARRERPATGRGRARVTRGPVPIAHAIGASDVGSAGVRHGLETRAPLRHGQPQARATRGPVPIASAFGASGAGSGGLRRGLETRAPLRHGQPQARATRGSAPIAHAIGASGGETNVRRRTAGNPEPAAQRMPPCVRQGVMCDGWSRNQIRSHSSVMARRSSDV